MTAPQRHVSLWDEDGHDEGAPELRVVGDVDEPGEAPAPPWRCPAHLRAPKPQFERIEEPQRIPRRAATMAEVEAIQHDVRTSKGRERVPQFAMDRDLMRQGVTEYVEVMPPPKWKLVKDAPCIVVDYGTPACPSNMSERASVRIMPATQDAGWWRKTLGDVAFRLTLHEQGASTAEGIQAGVIIAEASAHTRPIATREVLAQRIVAEVLGRRVRGALVGDHYVLHSGELEDVVKQVAAVMVRRGEVKP